MKIFSHLGTSDPDYRSIMKNHTDFYLDGKLIPASQVVITQQTHSDLVHICTEADAGAGFGDHPQIPVADGMVTNLPRLYLLIRTADCTPVLFADERKGVVAAVHSGREGTRKNIAGKAVQVMYSHFGCDPGDISAWIGAGICQRHYEVSPAIWEEFLRSQQQQGFHPDQRLHRHINIRHSIFQQLIASGIPFRNIEQDQTCTFESGRHFSYRRDGSHNRQINIIGIEDE